MKDKTMPRSYKPEVIADSTGKWSSNSLRFKTEQEAYANVQNLAAKWFAVREYRVVESDDEPTYRWIDGQLQEIKSCAHAWILDESNIEVCSKCGEERGELR